MACWARQRATQHGELHDASEIHMDDHFPTDRRIESTAASTPRFVLDAITRSDGEEESAESE